MSKEFVVEFGSGSFFLFFDNFLTSFQWGKEGLLMFIADGVQEPLDSRTVLFMVHASICEGMGRFVSVDVANMVAEIKHSKVRCVQGHWRGHKAILCELPGNQSFVYCCMDGEWYAQFVPSLEGEVS